MRKPARPAPPPELPIAERLEDVRAHFGFPSLRSFWSHVVEGVPEGERWSYEAIRNYHYDREPPVSYLARVAEVFTEISLEWLVAGRGEMVRASGLSEANALFGSEDDHAFRIVAAFQEGAGARWVEDGGRRRLDRPPLPMHTGGTPMRLLGRLWWARKGARERLGGRALSLEEEVELAREIGRAIVAPLMALGINYQASARMRFFLIEHIEAMTPVLFRALVHEDPPALDAATLRRPAEGG